MEPETEVIQEEKGPNAPQVERKTPFEYEITGGLRQESLVSGERVVTTQKKILSTAVLIYRAD